jgi:hypothetical protein
MSVIVTVGRSFCISANSARALAYCSISTLDNVVCIYPTAASKNLFAVIFDGPFVLIKRFANRYAIGLHRAFPGEECGAGLVTERFSYNVHLGMRPVFGT